MAWAELKKRLGNNCPTLICTSKGGSLWPALKALIDALGLQDKVVFTDTVDTATLVKLYQSCSFVIVPTLYEGGGSGPVAEAYLAGKPVVCSRIPQIEEQLQWYGVRYTMYFDPKSVNSIADAVKSALDRLPELESRTQEDQQRLAPLVPKLWEEWAAFYTKQMRIIARK
jgi:glycosyltransferase involved in cell wall biosynthesis